MPSYFHQLHQQKEPLLLINIWDPASAVLAQQQGAKAIGTSSAALAWSLGYKDGEHLPVVELLAAVKRIQRVNKLPLSVDIETGYSKDPEQVAKLVVQLVASGVAGINLEDGNESPELLCAKIRSCREALAGKELFINARTDIYLARLAEGQTAVELCMQRAALYQAAGADGLFIPCLTEPLAIQQLCQSIQIPINLMWLADLPDKTELAALGVKRLSYGPALFLHCYQSLQNEMALLSGSVVAPAEPLSGARLEHCYENSAAE
ncbi:MAG: isocitrate lyase/phosphoenolpyruvate mutase family protein [Gammaproteobacteria bacterium]|nr:isocitrate lyase/phosphoenolpyruvate mutase family protein [Gammaproteobacteria bacterium]MBU2056263.1 isocitrate lyase/phosphoenolpyruvate mutase family protein [Gammaproteobacteria bacterium]MBU2174678.1 isocitrate lyase/phosphoenolpyruvate mutase family protein [Gammaproteobacteria bacterium]MBU2248839.1 isocitrate lyase/phosphoenolpyruvate mutase family protein [Gammaproteobacteria bacterium]MBU2344546.1 isocitrate lyase/phosphoenolpyruvate mutase family protein [Gammaproteobacteria bact